MDYFKEPVNGSDEKQEVLNRLEFVIQRSEFLLGTYKAFTK